MGNLHCWFSVHILNYFIDNIAVVLNGFCNVYFYYICQLFHFLENFYSVNEIQFKVLRFSFFLFLFEIFSFFIYLFAAICVKSYLKQTNKYSHNKHIKTIGIFELFSMFMFIFSCIIIITDYLRFKYIVDYPCHTDYC